jgi:glycosyltransferase involved in cell wall biosynthesis
MGNYIIIAPCYNEEKALPSFLTELETIFNKTTHAFLVVIVDDCSTDASSEILRNFSFNSNRCKIEVVRLKYNMGHQKAIREGLKYASQRDADRTPRFRHCFYQPGKKK